MTPIAETSRVLKNVTTKPGCEARWGLARGAYEAVREPARGTATISSPRGQAMLEYSVLNWLLIVALVLGCTVRVIPGPERQKNLIELFFNAFQVHYDSFYFLLNSALP
jgi:hypothetical protein